MAGGKMRKEKAKPSGVPYQGGISFHKSKGQHILKNPLLVDSIVQKSGIKSTDVVLEIGPGTGNLTKKLLDAGKSVIAVELDPRMVLELQRRFQGTPYSNRLKKIWHLYAEFSWLLIITSRKRSIGRRATYWKFAMRLVAQPGDNLYCRLAANTQLRARVSHLLKVGKNKFRPPPKVDSSVVRIEPRRPGPDANLVREFDGLMRVCFNRKNKTLGSLFRQKSVLSMMEKNYKTLQALQGSMEFGAVDNLDFGDTEEDLKMDDEMELEDSEGGEKSEFKAKVLSVLKEGDFEEKRSSKLTQQEFLYLLSLFNKAGIHFS